MDAAPMQADQALFLRQSSLAPERVVERPKAASYDGDDMPEMDGGMRLMYMANEGDLDGICEALDDGVDVNFRDIDNRTPLHLAACQGSSQVVELLLNKGAEVDLKDVWGSTPLADAIHYKNHHVIKILEKHGAKQLVAPMRVQHKKEVPEYEIDSAELDFSKSVDITKGTFRKVSWRGIEVAVKQFEEEVFDEGDKVRAFRDELDLLQKIRHPNVVQFLGAVTQSSPMMIVTEYLPKGDLRKYLDRRGALDLTKVVRFALDIARGMNYLHENKPSPIIHCDLEPSNILLDDSGHLKVADFNVSKLLRVTGSVPKDLDKADSCRYAAPEVFGTKDYDTKVDVFSFALILQEMIEGCPPFPAKKDKDIRKAYAAKERPPFNAPSNRYAHGLKNLIEVCWSQKPSERPTFRQIINKLVYIDYAMTHKSTWSQMFQFTCFSNSHPRPHRNHHLGPSERSSSSSSSGSSS
uniref:Protein kinase domain-containing protein n=1 Tax=Kalanchoe fedtschenkoi TaxID=63787 RepID=A0A7N0T4D7_KALFE